MCCAACFGGQSAEASLFATSADFVSDVPAVQEASRLIPAAPVPSVGVPSMHSISFRGFVRSRGPATDSFELRTRVAVRGVVRACTVHLILTHNRE